MILPHDILAAPPHVQAHYQRMVEDGATERFAEMCALRHPPGLKGTNSCYLAGRGNNADLDSMPKEMRTKYLEAAQAAGVTVHGKVYASGLATKACDPDAWVSDKDDLTARCKAKGFTCEDA